MTLSIASATSVPLAAAIKQYVEVSDVLNFVGLPNEACPRVPNLTFYYTMFDSPVKEGVLPLAGRVVNRRVREQLARWQRGQIEAQLQCAIPIFAQPEKEQRRIEILSDALKRVDAWEQESLKSTRVSIAPARVEASDASTREESPPNVWPQTQHVVVDDSPLQPVIRHTAL